SCFTLGPLRIWVRTGTKITSLPSDCQGPNRGHRTPQETGAFTRTRPTPDEPIPGTNDSYKEKITLPRSSVDVSDSVALPHCPEGPISVSVLGILTPFPCGRQRDKHELCLRFSADVRASETDFLRSP
ncbi:hypothetical protein JTE90_016395, partial [Oedothorax gibbosus]